MCFVLSECHIEFLRTFLNKVRIICPSLEISNGALKGTVPRDFSLQICFMSQFPPSHWESYQGRFAFFSKMQREICSSRCTICHWCRSQRWSMKISGRIGPPMGVVDTCSAPWLANTSANFRKNLNDPNVIIGGFGQDTSWKYMKQKILWHFPFNYCIWKLFLLNLLFMYCVQTAENIFAWHILGKGSKKMFAESRTWI